MPDDKSSEIDNGFAQCLEQARAGNPAAAGQLLESCRAYLLAIANQDLDDGLRSKFGASDIVQQSMLSAHRSLEQFRGGTRPEFYGWLRRILINDLRDARKQFSATQCRDAKREQDPGDGQCGSRFLTDGQLTPGSRIVQKEQAQLVRDAIKQLPENHQRVVELRHWNEMSFAEIGKQMGCSEDAARKLWYRAIVALQLLLRVDSSTSGERSMGGLA